MTGAGIYNKELKLGILDTVSGGQPFECSYNGTDLERAGITYQNVIFGKDRYYIGKHRITKELAKTLMDRSVDLWNDKYAESGDLVGFIREWRGVLSSEYGLQWDGSFGDYSLKFD